MEKKKRLPPYELTPDAQAELPIWHSRWLKIALNTDPMTDVDREVMRTAVEGLYSAAGLKPPPRERIVFVPSPIVAVNAGGFAAAIWYLRANPDFAKKIGATARADKRAVAAATWAATADATRDATGDATWAATRAATWAATGDATWAATRAATGDATRAATGDATWAATADATRDATGDATGDATWAATRAATGDATWAATGDATGDATRAATWDATRDATWAATGDATWAATRVATWDATRDATWDATRDATGAATWDATGAATGAATGRKLSPLTCWMLDCANNAHNMWAYGGEWTGYDEWIEFLRRVCGYERDSRVDYSKWEPWHQATMHGGVRIMHKEFCIVADRPEVIKIETVNGRGRLHCVDGPAKRYRDGWSIYAVHGVRVPAQIVEAPETLTIAQIQSEQNTEVRRVMISRFGQTRYLRESNAKVIHEDQYGKLWSAERPGDTPLVMLECLNGSPEPIGYKPEDGESGQWMGSRWHKIYWLRVPPTVTTAHDAERWIHGVERYAPMVRT